MSESVSRSRKVKQEEGKPETWVPSPSATVSVPREELTTPPFSVQELRDCVPAHCFVKSNAISFTYLAVDLAIVTALLFVGAFLHFQANMPTWLAVIVWPIYFLVQVRSYRTRIRNTSVKNAFCLSTSFLLPFLGQIPPTSET